MKKIKLLVVVLLCFFCVNSIYAVEANNYPNSINESDVFEFQVELDDAATPANEIFDFSKISFASDVSGKTIKGSDSFKRIYSIYTPSCPASNPSCENQEVTFTAYCFDGNKKYPEYNKLYKELGESSDTATQVIYYKTLAIYRVFEMCGAKSTCTLFNNINGYTALKYSDSVGETTIDAPTVATLNSFNAGDEVSANISSFGIIKKDGSIVNFTASELSAALGVSLTDGKLVVSFDKDNFKSNSYTAYNIPESSIKYKNALWIMEHSYPILSLEQALSKAGVDYGNLKTQIATLSNIENTEANSTTLTNEVKKYVYATTQYAIWKVVGEYYEVSGGENIHLGSSLNGSTELDKLYQFLVANRTVSDTYATDSITRDFTVTNPTTDLYKTLSDAFMYGPYKVSSNMLYTGDITVSLANAINGVTLVDAAGNTITKISDGGEVYIMIKKDTKVSSVKINFATEDGYVFSDNNIRGKLFLSESSLDQVLGTGPSLVKVTGNGSTDILINPKTGVEDIGTILLVALIAFTLGYFVLRLKQNPINEL